VKVRTTLHCREFANISCNGKATLCSLLIAELHVTENNIKILSVAQ